MDITQLIENEVLNISIQGELDANSSIELDAVIKEAIERQMINIMIDCKGLVYISSAGLGVFISHLDDLKSYGGKFVFYQMDPAVYNVFEILGLHTIMEIVGSKFEAQTLMNES